MLRLEQLAQRQSDVLANKLGNDGVPAREIPLRPLPYGSEGMTSPTYVAQTPPSARMMFADVPTAPMEEPSFRGPGAMWEKNETFPTHETPLGPTEEERDVLDN